MLAGGPARISGEAPAGWGGGGAKGPADQECDSFNQDRWSWEEAKEHAKARRQAVCDSQADGLGGVAAGHGQQGSAGVDGQDLDEFEADLEDNLYKIWNRMSSGTWFPPPVRAVEIPKPHGGGVRMLGVPTIADRVAQTVVAMHLEPVVEPRFHPDSYGYRPGRSAHDALAACRQRCWKYDWVIDLDVQKFFDKVPWDLMVKAVQAVTDCSWVLLYVKRWLAAPLQHPDGMLERETRELRKDRRSRRSWRTCSCTTRSIHGWSGSSRAAHWSAMPTMLSCIARAATQAELVLGRIAARMDEVGLRLHPDKTRIVYCKDGQRRGEHEHISFTFLGYAFRARGATQQGPEHSPRSCLRSAPRRSRPRAPGSANCGSIGAPTCR